jgi:hypothetical protein
VEALMDFIFLLVLTFVAISVEHDLEKVNDHLAAIQQELAQHQTVTPDGIKQPEE